MKRVLLLTAVLAISNSALAAADEYVGNITCAIVSHEMTETGEAVATVADKYQLDSNVAHCVQVSSAIIEINALENSGSGNGQTPP